MRPFVSVHVCLLYNRSDVLPYAAWRATLHYGSYLALSGPIIGYLLPALLALVVCCFLSDTVDSFPSSDVLRIRHNYRCLQYCLSPLKPVRIWARVPLRKQKQTLLLQVASVVHSSSNGARMVDRQDRDRHASIFGA